MNLYQSKLYGNSLFAQKMKFSITDFFSKCDQIRSFLQIWSQLLKESVMENFIFCAVNSLAVLICLEMIYLTISIPIV